MELPGLEPNSPAHSGARTDTHTKLLRVVWILTVSALLSPCLHGQAVGGLDTCPLQAVVELGIFVRDYIKLGRMPHHLDADITGVLVGEKLVGEVDNAGEHITQDSQDELSGDQPPQALRDWLMLGNDSDNAVNDQLTDIKDGKRLNGDQDAKENTQADDRGTGVPDDLQHWWKVAQRRQALLPGAG